MVQRARSIALSEVVAVAPAAREDRNRYSCLGSWSSSRGERVDVATRAGLNVRPGCADDLRRRVRTGQGRRSLRGRNAVVSRPRRRRVLKTRSGPDQAASRW